MWIQCHLSVVLLNFGNQLELQSRAALAVTSLGFSGLELVLIRLQPEAALAAKEIPPPFRRRRLHS